MQSNETGVIQCYSIRLVLTRDMLDISVFARITNVCWLVIQSRMSTSSQCAVLGTRSAG
jgi:hypothetical protein